jgi:hypothetical protein
MPLVGTLIGAGLVAWISWGFQDEIREKFVRPTCATPSGLLQVPNDELRADGESDPGFTADAAIDGYLGSLWVPPRKVDATNPHGAVFVDSTTRRTLTLKLPSSVDLRLVCVNNGLVNSETNYLNWGKARTVQVWAGNRRDHDPVVLAANPSTDMLDMQEVARDLGESSTVHLRVDDSYNGVTVETFDPDSCGVPDSEIVRRDVDGERVELRYVDGCLRAAVPEAGISEVALYYEP